MLAKQLDEYKNENNKILLSANNTIASHITDLSEDTEMYKKKFPELCFIHEETIYAAKKFQALFRVKILNENNCSYAWENNSVGHLYE